MLKRMVFWALFCVFTLTVFSQVSINQLYDDFLCEKNVTNVQVSGLLMWMAKPFIKDHFSGSISGVKILSLEECADDVKARFNRQALSFRDKRYELFLKTNNKDEKVRIFVKLKKEMIHEMIVITMGNDPNLIFLKGKINPEDIEKMVTKNN